MKFKKFMDDPHGWVIAPMYCDGTHLFNDRTVAYPLKDVMRVTRMTKEEIGSALPEMILREYGQELWAVLRDHVKGVIATHGTRI